MCSQVHDELVFEVPEDFLPEVRTFVLPTAHFTHHYV
jgi:DNA polymerase I-like protein with 3'-5' exonuclease and polymerase domains